MDQLERGCIRMPMARVNHERWELVRAAPLFCSAAIQNLPVLPSPGLLVSNTARGVILNASDGMPAFMETIMSNQRFAPGRYLPVGVLALLLLVGYGLLQYPAIMREASTLTLGFTLALLALYGIAGLALCLCASNEAKLALRSGTWIGLVLAAVMIAHMVVENFVPISQPWTTAISLGLFPVLFLGFGIAGGHGAWSTGRWQLGLLTGIWSAMLSVTLVCIFGFVVNFACMRHMEEMLRNSAEFQRSGMHDLAAFTIFNCVDATGSHLFIAPLLATVFGSFGGMIGCVLSRRRSPIKSVTPADSTPPNHVAKLIVGPAVS
jgi:hypothetical protein